MFENRPEHISGAQWSGVVFLGGSRVSRLLWKCTDNLEWKRFASQCASRLSLWKLGVRIDSHKQSVFI